MTDQDGRQTQENGSSFVVDLADLVEAVAETETDPVGDAAVGAECVGTVVGAVSGCEAGVEALDVASGVGAVLEGLFDLLGGLAP